MSWFLDIVKLKADYLFFVTMLKEKQSPVRSSCFGFWEIPLPSFKQRIARLEGALRTQIKTPWLLLVPSQPTLRFVDEYCELYAHLFAEVRSFEAFKYLHET
jgi:hypothetical protein